MRAKVSHILGRTAFVLAVAFAFSGCAHNPTQAEAEIVRSFNSELPQALDAIEKSAVAAGFVRHSETEYRFVTSTTKDPVLNVIELSKEMRTGIGMRIEVMSQTRPVMISFHPDVMAHVFGSFMRAPVAPGSKEHSRVVSVVENARTIAERPVASN